MIAKIDLENMEFRAGHGCYELEKVVGNRFLVDISLWAEVGDAADRDDLSSSVNYLTVYEIVRREMAVTSNILENVAKRIAESIRAEFSITEKVTVKVAKLTPPLGGKIGSVSVTLTL